MVQIPNLGPGSASTLPIPNPGTTTPNLGLSLCVPPDSAANFAAIDALLSGATPGSLPIIQSKVTAVNTTAVQSISETAPLTTLYAVSLFMQSLGTGGVGHTVTATITYISPSSLTPLTITVTMQLSSANVVLETYPLLVAAGTTITLVTSYGGGATNDPYTISAKLVEMP